MLRLPLRPLWTSISWRRSAAAALIALQAVIAVSPMLERRDEVRRDAHVEALGNRHLFAHDESTCGVCVARTLVGTVPPQAVPLCPDASIGRVDIAYLIAARPTGVAADNHSRAPPKLG